MNQKEKEETIRASNVLISHFLEAKIGFEVGSMRPTPMDPSDHTASDVVRPR